MKIEVKPIVVSHEAILGLHLHERYLSAEYERIVKTADGVIINTQHDIEESLSAIKRKMLDCQKAREFLERNLLYLDDIKEVIE